MTRLVLAYTLASAVFADTLGQELRNKGYTVPEYPSANTFLTPSRLERAIVGSAAVVLLWESSAAFPQWEALHIGTVQRFQKPLFPLLLDDTPLPSTLAGLSTLSGLLPAGPTVAALSTLPGFPSARSTDPLHLLHEEATNTLIRVRRAAIAKAATMLTQEQYRDSVLLLLTYLAEYDQTTILQQEAGKVLRDYMPTQPFTDPQAALMVGGRCEKGHISYYNKRDICQRYRRIAYAPRAGQRDELIVACQTPDCLLKVVVHVDCGAFDE
jgi:hypothetical protein